MYRMYEEKYQQQGKKAMEDTMARANANSGGYGSSYAQAVGQQTYDSYLTNLNDIIPTLRDDAYQQYANEGDDLRQQYALYADLEDQAYNRAQDEYDKWAADRNYWYQRQQDEIAQANWEREFQAAQAAAARSSGGGGGGSYRSSGDGSGNDSGSGTGYYNNATKAYMSYDELENLAKKYIALKNKPSIKAYMGETVLGDARKAMEEIIRKLS